MERIIFKQASAQPGRLRPPHGPSNGRRAPVEPGRAGSSVDSVAGSPENRAGQCVFNEMIWLFWPTLPAAATSAAGRRAAAAATA